MTVLFADLVGFTSQAERMDPEDVRALLVPYHQRLRAELERFGGTVEKFIGDAVMALFGAPVVHEDDPERAVLSALAIRDWVLEESGLQVRVAVNTGEALIALGADPAAGEGMASGDVVNSTARLQSAAPINAILVGESTYRATRQMIDYRMAEAVVAKGKYRPIPVWEAIAPRSKLGVDVVQAARTPLIGRDRELTLLLNTAQRVRDDRETQLVTLIGVPGIGKSRLTFELFQAVARDDGVLWRQGRCLPYGNGVAFWALGEIVKSHAEIFEGDAAERAEQKLSRAIAEVIPDENEAEWVARHLRPLVGMEREKSGFMRDSQADAFAAWRRFFEALADRIPLVLVIEDLQWADEQLLDFVDHLVDWTAGVPLLVVCTARPELLEQRPGWGGGKANASTLSLRPLSDEETSGLLAANLARPVLEAELHRALLERAGGNPLYAEQYARMLVEREQPDELPLPETVQAIVAARLDGLSLDEKELLHDAAVHGKVFWVGAVAAMSGGERSAVEEHLHGLERKEFVRRQRRSSVAGEPEYAFRHMLVRDVAYAQIPRRLRGEKHRLAAEWIDSLVVDRDDHVELLADHYQRALELARATGGDETLIAVPARLAFRRAGERAYWLGALDAATRFYQQALELWPPDDHDRARVLLELVTSRESVDELAETQAAEARDALLAQGDRGQAAQAEAMLSGIAWGQGRGDAATAHAQRALELARDVPASNSKAWVLWQSAFDLSVRGSTEQALEHAEELRRIAEEIGSQEWLASALSLIGTSRIELGDLDGLEDAEGSVALSRQIRSHWLPVYAGHLALTLFDLGSLDRAFELVAESHADATRRGDRPTMAWLDILKMRELYWRGSWDEAFSLATELAPETNNVRCYTVRAQIQLARGRLQDALDDAAKALETGRTRKDPQALHTALAVHARASLASGAPSEALAAVDELLERFVSEGTQQLSATLPDLSTTALDLGRIDAFLQAVRAIEKQTPWIDAARAFATCDFAGAASTYAQIGSQPDAAYARLRAAQALVEEGCRAEADRPLQDAVAFYLSVGATAYLGQAEALLATAR